MKKITEHMMEKYGCEDCADVVMDGKIPVIGNLSCPHFVCPYRNLFNNYKTYEEFVEMCEEKNPYICTV